VKAVPKPTSTFTVNFNGARKPPTRSVERHIPRVTRLLVLAHRVERAIQSGEFRNLADAARAMGMTRARMTQIMNLLLLAPEIQEVILDLPTITNRQDPVTERQVRRIVAEPHWIEQRVLWSEVRRCRG